MRNPRRGIDRPRVATCQIARPPSTGNCPISPVAPITGQIALTRTLSGPSSTAIDLDSRFTAPFEALYQAGEHAIACLNQATLRMHMSKWVLRHLLPMRQVQMGNRWLFVVKRSTGKSGKSRKMCPLPSSINNCLLLYK